MRGARPSKRRRIQSESSDISSVAKTHIKPNPCTHIEKAKLEEFMAECKDTDWSLLNKKWIRTNPNSGEYGTRVFCKYGNGDEYYPATLVEVRSHEIQVIFDDYQMKLKKVLVKKQDVLSIAQIPTGTLHQHTKNKLNNKNLLKTSIFFGCKPHRSDDFCSTRRPWRVFRSYNYCVLPKVESDR